MSTILINCPEVILRSFHVSESQFADDLRTAAAIKFFEWGKLSTGRAAELAGMSRLAFLHKLAESGVSIYNDFGESLDQDVATARQEAE